MVDQPGNRDDNKDNKSITQKRDHPVAQHLAEIVTQIGHQRQRSQIVRLPVFDMNQRKGALQHVVGKGFGTGVNILYSSWLTQAHGTNLRQRRKSLDLQFDLLAIKCPKAIDECRPGKFTD